MLANLLLVLLVVGIGATVLTLALTVDDWRRDLTTNYAATADDHADPRLRPVDSTEAPRAMADRVERAVGELRRWRLERRTETEGGVDLHLVRTTPLFGFQDDVVVRVRPAAGDGSRVTAESRSRVGRGDLGQNPRNLREILDKLRSPGP